MLLGTNDVNATSHADDIHLEDRAAGIVADLVVDFLMGKFEPATRAPVLPD